MFAELAHCIHNAHIFTQFSSPAMVNSFGLHTGGGKISTNTGVRLDSWPSPMNEPVYRYFILVPCLLLFENQFIRYKLSQFKALLVKYTLLTTKTHSRPQFFSILYISPMLRRIIIFIYQRLEQVVCFIQRYMYVQLRVSFNW